MDVAVSQLSLGKYGRKWRRPKLISAIGDSSTPAVVETNELVEPAPKRRRIYEEDGIGQSGELEVVFQHQHEVHKIAVDARTAADKANVRILVFPHPVLSSMSNTPTERHRKIGSGSEQTHASCRKATAERFGRAA